MAFFDNLGKKIGDTASAAVAKSKEIAETTKLNMAISSEEDAIRKNYTSIGEIYFHQISAGDLNPSECEQFIANIHASREKIEGLRRKLSEVKPTISCPGCGKELAKTAKFCDGCGTKIEPVQQAAPVQDTAPAGRICTECGHVSGSDSAFCENCGHAFN